LVADRGDHVAYLADLGGEDQPHPWRYRSAASWLSMRVAVTSTNGIVSQSSTAARAGGVHDRGART
jgi:hypothetical protein